MMAALGKDNNINTCARMFTSVVFFYFRLLTPIVFSKTKPDYVYYILGGRMMGLRTIENMHRDN